MILVESPAKINDANPIAIEIERVPDSNQYNADSIPPINGIGPVLHSNQKIAQEEEILENLGFPRNDNNI